MTELVYHLTPTGDLCAIPGPGRCPLYWQRWHEHITLRAKIPTAPARQLDQLRQAVEAARIKLATHLDNCTTCQAWLADCERTVMLFIPPDLTPPAALQAANQSLS